MRVSARCALLVVFVALFGGTCHTDSPTGPHPPPGTNAVNDGLVFTRPNGTAIPMGKTYAVCCSTWEAGTIDREAIKIFYYDTTKRLSYWKMFLIPSRLAQDMAVSLPTPAPGTGAVALSAAEIGTGNQTSSERPGSSGTVTVHSFACGPPTHVDVDVDAVLGSRDSLGEAIHVRGKFTATVYKNPISCVFSF